MGHILHVTRTAAWERARADGVYGSELVATDGFLHFCTPAQLVGVVARHFDDDAAGLVALEVEAERVEADLRWEATPPSEERFPHLYRALKAEEVDAVRPVAKRLGPPRKITLADALGSFEERWAPRVVAELNGQEVKVAKLEGEFPMHHHDEEDELFLVLSGRLRMRFRHGKIELGPGELVVVPRGVEHQPAPDGLVEVLLFEPAGTLNTGNVRSGQTREALERL